MSSIYNSLQHVRNEKGAGFIVLIDPDKLEPRHLPRVAAACEHADVDAFFLGGSLLHATELDDYVRCLKDATTLPVIGFPGYLSQISGVLDAVLFLSVISGRNPEFLFGQHVHAAPIIRRLGIEPIGTGYLLIESGSTTTAQYMSHSMPIPHRKPDVAAATALAAEMLGMKLLFADAGSGADHIIPDEMVHAIAETCTIPLVVGGGITTPDEVASKVQAGASFVVVGNAIERNPDSSYIADLASAAHALVPRFGSLRV
ncbi:MAG TPA: geranylgeranylglyceryl/heptaprenylglyceryl phosphate synthase [Rhodothermales bacterium]|nr:geranylgeranylglyceryl/heptaprenylglyceryl phosphate synthase [Rhodothermales bacterium]